MSARMKLLNRLQCDLVLGVYLGHFPAEFSSQMTDK
jgi:hypothetical protein